VIILKGILCLKINKKILDQTDEFQQVEMNPTQAAVECLTVEEFDLDIEFSVAIGDEFVPILRTKSDLSGSMKDWSTRVR